MPISSRPTMLWETLSQRLSLWTVFTANGNHGLRSVVSFTSLKFPWPTLSHNKYPRKFCVASSKFLLLSRLYRIAGKAIKGNLHESRCFGGSESEGSYLTQWCNAEGEPSYPIANDGWQVNDKPSAMESSVTICRAKAFPVQQERSNKKMCLHAVSKEMRREETVHTYVHIHIRSFLSFMFWRAFAQWSSTNTRTSFAACTMHRECERRSIAVRYF